MSPMVKAKDLRAVPEAELRQQLAQTRKELSRLRLKARQGALEQPHQIRTMRRDMARMLTVLAEQARRTRSQDVVQAR